MLVDNTLPDDATGDGGYGVEAVGGASVTLRASRLTANGDIALWAYGVSGRWPTRIFGERLVVDGTRARADNGRGGNAVAAAGGASFTCDGCRLSDNEDAAVIGHGAGSGLALRGTLVDGTRPRPGAETSGYGVWAEESAVTLEDVRLSGNAARGLRVVGAGATLEASGLLVDGTTRNPDEATRPAGLSVEQGARATLADARVNGTSGRGLVVERGAEVAATGLLLDANEDVGLQTFAEGIVELVDARISGNRITGLLLDGDGTAGDVAGLLVDGTRPEEGTGGFGDGVSVGQGASLTLTAARISGNRRVGILVVGADARVSRTLVDGTMPEEASGALGRPKGDLGVPPRQFGVTQRPTEDDIDPVEGERFRRGHEPLAPAPRLDGGREREDEDRQRGRLRPGEQGFAGDGRAGGVSRGHRGSCGASFGQR